MSNIEYERLRVVDLKLKKALELLRKGETNQAMEEIKEARVILMAGIY